MKNIDEKIKFKSIIKKQPTRLKEREISQKKYEEGKKENEHQIKSEIKREMNKETERKFDKKRVSEY